MWKSSQRQLDSHIPTAPAATAAAPIFDLLAIVRPVLAYSGTVQRSACSRCSLPSVSRPAALPKLNLRGRYCATVPANGCLAKLLLWPYSKIAGWSAPFQRFGKPQVQGDLRLPLTSTYHGCPPVSPVYTVYSSVRKSVSLDLQRVQRSFHLSVFTVSVSSCKLTVVAEPSATRTRLQTGNDTPSLTKTS
jgi:hypothetical protein